MFETLESRTLFSTNPVDASTVALYSSTGSPTSIARHQPLWIVIHGMDSSKDDPAIQQLAAAVQAGEPDDQTLILDWSTLASSQAAPDGAAAYANAWAAADKIAALIKAARVPSTRVNLIGFSMGGQVEDRLAQDLATPTGKVNRLIAIDPAAPGYATNNAGHTARHLPAFATDASYSIAFCAADGDSFPAAGLAATDTVLLQNLPGDDVERHVETEYALTRMFRRSAGLETATGENVSGVFSLANITAGDLPAWRKDAYGAGYEAVITCSTDAADPPLDTVPATLIYINRRGHRIQI